MDVTFTTEEVNLLRKIIVNAPMQGSFLTLSPTILMMTTILEKLNDQPTEQPDSDE